MNVREAIQSLSVAEAKAVLWELIAALREGDTEWVFRLLFERGMDGDLEPERGDEQDFQQAGSSCGLHFGAVEQSGVALSESLTAFRGHPIIGRVTRSSRPSLFPRVPAGHPSRDEVPRWTPCPAQQGRASHLALKILNPSIDRLPDNSSHQLSANVISIAGLSAKG
jgi:hypothetical protein